MASYTTLAARRVVTPARLTWWRRGDRFSLHAKYVFLFVVSAVAGDVWAERECPVYQQSLPRGCSAQRQAFPESFHSGNSSAFIS